MRTKLIRQCRYPDCSVLTMGELCLQHELPVVRDFVRGRPWSPALVPVRERVPALAAAVSSSRRPLR